MKLLIKTLPFVGGIAVLVGLGQALHAGHMGQVALVWIFLGFLLMLALFIKTDSGRLKGLFRWGRIALLALLNLLVFNLLVMNHSGQWDWTRSNRHSLAPLTRQVIQGLTEKVQVDVLMVENQEETARFLRPFSRLNPRLVANVCNPYQPLPELETLGKKPGPHQVWVRCGDKVTAFGLNAEKPLSQNRRAVEQDLLRAILQVSRNRTLKVWFLTGHGEKTPKALHGEGAESRSVFRFAQNLHRDNMDVQSLNLRREGRIPPGVDVLVAAGPQEDYADWEVDALRQWLEEGGALLALLDPPLAPENATPRLEQLLADFGVQAPPRYVVDYADSDSEQTYFVPLVQRFHGSHPITEKLQGLGLHLPLYYCRPLGFTEKAAALEKTALFQTSDQSWSIDLASWLQVARQGKMTSPPRDRWSTQALAVALKSPDEKGPRLVVMGDSDFLSNARLNELGTLLGYFAVQWLSGDQGLLELPPLETRPEPLVLTARQRNLIAIPAVILLPFGVFFGGLAYTTWRRRQG